jgi:hypothetical protein
MPDDPLADFRDNAPIGAPPVASVPSLSGNAPAGMTGLAPLSAPPAVSPPPPPVGAAPMYPPTQSATVPVAPSMVPPGTDDFHDFISQLPPHPNQNEYPGAPPPFVLPRPAQNDETPASQAAWEHFNGNFAPMTDESRTAQAVAWHDQYNQNAPIGREGFDAPINRNPAENFDIPAKTPEQKVQQKLLEGQAKIYRNVFETHPDMANLAGLNPDMSKNSPADFIAAHKFYGELAVTGAKTKAQQAAAAKTAQVEADKKAAQDLKEKNFQATEADKKNAATATQERFDATQANKTAAATTKAASAPPTLRTITDDKGHKVTEQWIPETKSWGAPTGRAASADALIDKYLK